MYIQQRLCKLYLLKQYIYSGKQNNSYTEVMFGKQLEMFSLRNQHGKPYIRKIYLYD